MPTKLTYRYFSLKDIAYSILLISLASPAMGQAKFVANYDESKIKAYQLPPILVDQKGEPVESAKEWRDHRRPELLELFTNQVYGRAPEACKISSKLISTSTESAKGKAIRREVDVTFGGEAGSVTMRLLIYTPKNATNSPAFLSLNFQGNHSVDPDPTISLNTNWMRNRSGVTQNNRSDEKSRGIASSRWPVEMIIDQGFALVTIYYGDIDPDFDDQFSNGVHAALSKEASEIPDAEKWGSIAGWAFGLSRALDYLEEDSMIDGSRVAVFGHSRLGKTSLWAGATDERFKMVISNNSGCGGAALSRRAIGETIARINRSFPHWFCDNYLQYNENENACPVDQHQLLALIAPRALYIASAKGDQWADPKGEFLSALGADAAYRLLDSEGLGGVKPPKSMPELNQPIRSGKIGYHIRSGDHDVTTYDWEQYLAFAKQNL
ncbi:MAG: alpha/beta hydrolase family protein [Rubripirellula sp.]